MKFNYNKMNVDLVCYAIIENKHCTLQMRKDMLYCVVLSVSSFKFHTIPGKHKRRN